MAPLTSVQASGLAVARSMKAQRNRLRTSLTAVWQGPKSGAAADCTASTSLPPWNSTSKTRAKETVGLKDL